MACGTTVWPQLLGTDPNLLGGLIAIIITTIIDAIIVIFEEVWDWCEESDDFKRWVHLLSNWWLWEAYGSSSASEWSLVSISLVTECSSNASAEWKP